jgi:CBS domain-containing protein
MFSTDRRFSSLSVDDALLVEKADIVKVRDTDLMFDALKILSHAKISGAPVISNKEGKDFCVGFLDVLDVVAFVVGKKASEGDIASVNIPVKEALADPGKVKFIKPSASITQAIECMVHYKVHRLIVLEDDFSGLQEFPILLAKVHSIVTQSDIFSLMVTFTYSLSEQDAKIFDKSVVNLPITLIKPRCCSLSDRTSDAYEQLHNNGFSSLGVINEAGKLVNYLGASHLKALTKGNLWDLYFPVGKFLETHQANFQSFPLSTTLQDTLSAIKESKFHRIFYVDDKGFPGGLLTLRDLLEIMVIKLKIFK